MFGRFDLGKPGNNSEETSRAGARGSQTIGEGRKRFMRPKSEP